MGNKHMEALLWYTLKLREYIVAGSLIVEMIRAVVPYVDASRFSVIKGRVGVGLCLNIR